MTFIIFPIESEKKKVSETGSDSYRHRASSKEHERSPNTENDNFDTEHDITGQNLCLAEFHISFKCLSNFTRKDFFSEKVTRLNDVPGSFPVVR